MKEAREAIGDFFDRAFVGPKTQARYRDWVLEALGALQDEGTPEVDPYSIAEKARKIHNPDESFKIIPPSTLFRVLDRLQEEGLVQLRTEDTGSPRIPCRLYYSLIEQPSQEPPTQ